MTGAALRTLPAPAARNSANFFHERHRRRSVRAPAAAIRQLREAPVLPDRRWADQAIEEARRNDRAQIELDR